MSDGSFTTYETGVDIETAAHCLVAYDLLVQYGNNHEPEFGKTFVKEVITKVFGQMGIEEYTAPGDAWVENGRQQRRRMLGNKAKIWSQLGHLNVLKESLDQLYEHLVHHADQAQGLEVVPWIEVVNNALNELEAGAITETEAEMLLKSLDIEIRLY